jgi:hypothetical protein
MPRLACAKARHKCASSPPPAAPVQAVVVPPISIAAQGPVIDDRTVISDADPHVERLMPLNLNAAVHTWVGNHLTATGVGANTLKVVIKDTSVIERVPPKEGGLQGLVTDQIDAEYVATVDVEVQIIDPSGSVLGHAQARLSHTRQILQRASLSERNTVWHDLVVELVRDLDQSLSREIRASFGQWVTN